jgi:hypothetical protein
MARLLEVPQKSEKTYALNRGYCCFCFMTNIGICCVFRITCKPLFYTTRGNDTCRHEGTTRADTRERHVQSREGANQPTTELSLNTLKMTG